MKNNPIFNSSVSPMHVATNRNKVFAARSTKQGVNNIKQSTRKSMSKSIRWPFSGSFPSTLAQTMLTTI